MFDISFGELLLIGVVALVVLGPERLPAVARTLGALVARAQRFVTSVKADIQQQTDLAGLASLKQDVQDTAYALKAQLAAELESTQSIVHSAQAELASVQAQVLAVPPAAVSDPQLEPVAALPPSEPLPAPVPEVAVAVAEPVPAPAALHPVAESQPVLAVEPSPVAPPVVNDNQLDLFAEPPSQSASRENTQ